MVIKILQNNTLPFFCYHLKRYKKAKKHYVIDSYIKVKILKKN